jgi:hypothetical protein
MLDLHFGVSSQLLTHVFSRVATFRLRFQPGAGPNRYRGSKPSPPLPSATAAGIFPGARETLAFPAAALQNDGLALRRAGPVGCRLGARAASGQGLLLAMVPIRKMPSRAGGPSKATRSGTGAHRCHTGSWSHLWPASGMRSSREGLRSAASSPARSAWLQSGSRHRHFSFCDRSGRRGGRHGTARPRR